MSIAKKDMSNVGSSQKQLIPLVTLTRLISEGGTALLYQGTSTHPHLPPTFIVKLSLIEGVLESEARLLASLDHACIPKSYKIPDTDSYIGHFVDTYGKDNWYIFLEYIEGRNLAEVINAHLLSFEDFLQIFDQIADCIDYINSFGICHFDIKPSNIVVGESKKAFLIDFGAWQEIGNKLRSKIIIGTPYYIPPERAKHFQDERYIVTASEDIFSFGATIVFSILLKSEPDLFVDARNSNASTLIKPHVLAELPTELRTLFSKLTSFHSEERFTTAGEIIATLKVHSEKISKLIFPIPHTSLNPTQIGYRLWSRKLIDLSIAVSFFLIVLGAIWVLLTEGQPVLRGILNSNYWLLIFGVLLLVLAYGTKRLIPIQGPVTIQSQVRYPTQILGKAASDRRENASVAASSPGQLKLPDVPRNEILPVGTGQKDEVHFRAFHPSEVEPGKTHSLVIYAHISALENAIGVDAESILKTQAISSENATKTASIAQGTPITVAIESKHATFDIEEMTNRWNGKYIRFLFSFNASSDLDIDDLQIRVRVSVFSIEVSSINISIPITPKTTHSNPLKAAKVASHSSKMYQKIFVSYSRRDRIVVDNYRLAQMALGNDVFVDRYSLKPGEDWQAGLAKAIDEADIFQLFWSEQSAQSSNCRDEWMYAIEEKCKDDAATEFIRPVFWTDPMTDKMKPPAELAHINFKYIPIQELSGQNELLLGKLESIEQRLAFLITLVESRKQDSAWIW